MTRCRNQRWTIAASLVGVVVLTLPACHIPDLRGARPAQTMPGVYEGDGLDGPISCENSAHLGIGQFFTDPILVGLIHQGLEGNQELRILNEEIQIANNEIRRSRGALFPFVTLGTRAGVEKSSEFTSQGAVESQLSIADGSFPDPLPNFLVAADVSWQIDIWRQLRNARDATTLRYLGTIDGRNYSITRLVAEISENYYELLALDARLENLNQTIELQERSLQVARNLKEAARGTELAVQRFQAEVRRNQSEKFIVEQRVVEVGNRINFLVGRYPQPVERSFGQFLDLNLPTLRVGVPSQLLLNRPDIRQAERELQAAGLDVRVARANFFPSLVIRAGVGFEAFNPRYLFMTPESLIYNVAGDLTAPLINRSAIKADYMNANARQLQRLYDYQRTVLNAFTEVVNRVSKVENYTRSIELKRQQLAALEASVSAAASLFQNARAEYVDVLFSQRDLRDARMDLIEAKQQQLSAIVTAYQALGGGWQMSPRVGPSDIIVLPTPPGEIVDPGEAVEPSPLPDPVESSDLDDAPAPPAAEPPVLTWTDGSRADPALSPSRASDASASLTADSIAEPTEEFEEFAAP